MNSSTDRDEYLGGGDDDIDHQQHKREQVRTDIDPSSASYDEYDQYDYFDTAPMQSSDLEKIDLDEEQDDGGVTTNLDGGIIIRSNSILKLRDDSSTIQSHLGESSMAQTIWIGMACFFVVIATVLGTGILALPVNVGETGFAPFMISITTCFFAQAFILLYMIELLQRTQALMHLKRMENQEAEQQQQQQQQQQDEEMSSTFDDHEDADVPDRAENGTASASTQVDVLEAKSKLLSEGPDLHTMAKFFLSKPLQLVFEASVMLHFVSILISYSLAGPEAYAQLFNISNKFMYLITPFVIVCSLVVILGDYFMQYIITGFTLAKGTLLIVMVFLVGYVANHVGLGSTNSWQYIGRPFLIGTVALGGAMNTLPVIYAKMKPTRRNIVVFQICACSALFVCYVLNVLWCYFVLKIVPQTGESPSLEAAKKGGHISTGPIIEVINKEYAQFKWLAKLVSAFVTLSVTVSFVTMSSGMKHMLDGYVKTFHGWQIKQDSNNSRFLRFLLQIKRLTDKVRVIDQVVLFDHLVQVTLYVVTFGLVWFFAQLNSDKFFLFLEVFTSCALNLESGFFVAFMLYVSRRPAMSDKYNISVVLPKWLVHTTLWLVGGYFLFAVFYDFVYTILRIFIGQSKLPF